MSNFDFLARHYNALTGYPGRIDSLTVAIRPWVEQWHVRDALDSGCGGAALMFALDNCGVRPVGLDLSEPMLRLAIANARERGCRFRFCGAPHESAGRIFPQAFDAVFCLGNALVGIADDREMVRSLTGLKDALRPGGGLLIQMLNQTPFFLGLKTLIKRSAVGDFEYVRVAAPATDGLTFCALCLGPDNTVESHISTWERWEHARLVDCVHNAGFSEIELFGGLNKKPFDQRCSADVVIAARRPLDDSR